MADFVTPITLSITACAATMELSVPDHASWLQRAAGDLGLNGKVVAMATAVKMENLSQASMSGGGAEVTCFATVGCGNALSAGDRAASDDTRESGASRLFTRSI